MRSPAAAILLLAACGGTEPLTNCPAGQPAIADCYVGEFFADCGGEGPPRLACTDQQHCLWFAADCAPATFHASACSTDDICCDDGYPFPPTDIGSDLTLKLTAFGSQPWDRHTHVALDVIVDPTLAGTTTVFTCSGPDPNLTSYTPCEDPIEVSATVGGTTVIRAWPGDPLRSGWYAWIELVGDAGVPAARMCALEMTDILGACPFAEPLCASTGSITISQYPVIDVRTLVVDVDAAFPTGFAVAATLVP